MVTGRTLLLVVVGNALMAAARFADGAPRAACWGAGLVAILAAVWGLPATGWALRRAILAVVAGSALLQLGFGALLSRLLSARP